MLIGIHLYSFGFDLFQFAPSSVFSISLNNLQLLNIENNFDFFLKKELEK